MGSASTMRPTAQGMAMRPMSRSDEFCTERTPRRSCSVRLFVMAGMMAMVMQGMKAQGKLKMVWQ